MSDKLVGLTTSTNSWITAIDLGETKDDLHNETVLQEITIPMQLHHTLSTIYFGKSLSDIKTTLFRYPYTTK